MSDNDPEPVEASDRAVAEELRVVRVGRGFRLGVAVGGMVAVAVVLLVAQNGHRTSVEWLWLDFHAAVWLLLVTTFLGGMIVAEAGRLAIRSARARSAGRRQAVDTARQRLRSR